MAWVFWFRVKKQKLTLFFRLVYFTLKEYLIINLSIFYEKHFCPPPKYKKLSRFGYFTLFSFLILMSLLVQSCIEEPENPQIAELETSRISQVRDWFETNKAKLRLPEKGSNFRTESQELILPFFEKEPGWDQFHHYYFPDGREVFEVSLENATMYIPQVKEQEASSLDTQVFQNIIFVKRPSDARFDPMIIRYYPDENTSNRDFKEISYQMIDDKWSGWIDIFTYDEHYVMGYKVDQGELTHTREMQVIAENAKKNGFGPENMDEAIHCYVVATDWYDGRTGEYLDTTHAQTCEWQRGGSQSGTGGGSTHGDGTGSGTGGTDGGGSTCSSCYDPPELPEPKLTITLDTTIKENRRARCIVGKIALSSFVNEIAEFTDTNGSSTTSILKMPGLLYDKNRNPINGQVQKINGIHHISISSSILNRGDLLVAKTILHELVHAEIYRALAKNNVTPLDDNFAVNFDRYVAMKLGDNDTQHAYMAEQLMEKMGKALMEIHRSQFPEDFQKFSQFMNFPGGYQGGIPLSFYKSVFWEGLKETKAYEDMIKNTSSVTFQEFKKADLFMDNLTKEC